ncbi:Transposon TX1 uncharacterized 149 kDa protein [Vitis vinifera]|uniref:Transposon TX1 uncharacterized 149 kDa protein n=1 Tax=Vitis vinifera TaxID=29760 RepID=A0A438KG42_VITVI|nr:Transposon TX1 uncharacterized 149 kDa protein [Vitis vinifera]
MSQGVIHSLGVGRFLGWGDVNARGAARENCDDGFMWFFTGVYGPTLKSYREPFWEELGAIRGLWSDPWCIGGDFNVIRFPSERSREGRLSGSMRRFSKVLDELALRDLPLQGGPYTWSGGLNGQSKSRLDRFLILEDWENHFSGVSQRTLPRPEEGFKELLKGWWQGFNYSGSYSFVLLEKLKALKIKLKNWNKEVFGKVGVNLRMALDKVSFWDDQERQRALNEQELEARKEAREEFKKWAIMEEISWRQKSRQTWLKEGDKNTGFFHKMANSNRLLSDPGDWHPSMSSMEFDRIGREEAARLEEMFSLEEVYLALSELNGDKAPGPNGFPIAFWQPISLVGGLYKILAKVIANRLKKVVSKVVSPTQNAFVEGRQILDAALTANEAIDSLLKGNEASVLCKLDLEKAYDHINWDFLKSVMQKMGFGEKWVGWIRWCISTASFSVLINSSPAGFFQSTRGLRQGDPISPYLFVLGMEALSCLINTAVRGGFLTGCRLRGRGGNGIQVSHLLFADDTLVFCEDSQDQMDWEELRMLRSWLLTGMQSGFPSSTYLGLPLGTPHKSVAMWDGVEERMRKRLALWKRQFISKGGRITLIRSTLASMSIYLMSLMRIPSVVRLRLEKIQRDFLWGGGPCCVNGAGALRLKESLFGSLLSAGSMGKKEEGRSLVRYVGSKLLGFYGGCGGWYPYFSRPFNDWELEAVASLLSFLQGKRLIVGMEDRVLWNASKNRIFFVKSLYNTLDSGGAVPFPWRIIWSPCVPTKVGFFAWEASWGKVLTQDQLKRRGWILANRCFLCCDDEETINHILIHCPKARVLWNLVFSLFGVNWVLPLTVRDTLLG